MEKVGRKMWTRAFVFSWILSRWAFASDVIEMDLRGAQDSHRLHILSSVSYLEDVSHLELHPEARKVIVFKKEETQGASLNVVLGQEAIVNLPWDLGREGLRVYLSQHTAFLTPLGEEAYKLEFRGALLGGMRRDERGSRRSP